MRRSTKPDSGSGGREASRNQRESKQGDSGLNRGGQSLSPQHPGKSWLRSRTPPCAPRACPVGAIVLELHLMSGDPYVAVVVPAQSLTRSAFFCTCHGRHRQQSSRKNHMAVLCRLQSTVIDHGCPPAIAHHSVHVLHIPQASSTPADLETTTAREGIRGSHRGEVKPIKKEISQPGSKKGKEKEWCRTGRGKRGT